MYKIGLITFDLPRDLAPFRIIKYRNRKTPTFFSYCVCLCIIDMMAAKKFQTDSFINKKKFLRVVLTLQ